VLVQPASICEELIRKYMVNYHREEKVFDREDMKTWELTHLELSYKNILEIDNLLGMDRLEELRLDNNIITKITGLETLVNIKWLDLSFNLIEKVEGLDCLTKMTDLSLYSNRIVELSGLDNLHELNVLSVGSNKLQSLEESIRYLCSLKNNLQVLRIDDNVFQKNQDKDYKKYAISRLDRLQYIDYQLIEASVRIKAKEDHKDEINEAGVEGEKGKDGDESGAIDQELVEAKIESTRNIFERVMSASESYKCVKELPSF